jgi:hypothetical protein
MDSDDERDRRPQPQLIDDNAGLHPLFWDAIPESAEKDPTWQALEALKEESTPEERADNFKVGPLPVPHPQRMTAIIHPRRMVWVPRNATVNYAVHRRMRVVLHVRPHRGVGLHVWATGCMAGQRAHPAPACMLHKG